MSYLSLLKGYPGIEKGGEYYMHCPWGENHREGRDRNRSLSVRVEDGVFHCFGCGERGIIARVVARLDGTTEQEARKKVGMSGNRGRVNGFRYAKNLNQQARELERIFETFPPITSGHFKEYIEGRGYSLRMARRFDLREGRILIGEDGDPDYKWLDRLIYTLRDAAGRIVSLEGRSIKPLHEIRFYKAAGSRAACGFIGDGKLRKTKKPIFVVEGLFDCMAVTGCGFTALGMGSMGLGKERIAILKGITNYPVIVLDGTDRGGRKQRSVITKRLHEDLSRSFARYRITEIPLAGKDPDEFHKSGRLKKWLESEIFLLTN